AVFGRFLHIFRVFPARNDGSACFKGRRSVAFEPLVAEHFEPMGMLGAGQQLARTFALALGPLAAWVAAMVEVELEQFQITRPEMAAQEEVAAQPAVEILDHRTGADGAASQSLDGL